MNSCYNFEPGTKFNYKGIEWVCLEIFDKNVYGDSAVLAITSEIIKTMKFSEKKEDGCNDWRKSKIRKWLNSEFLAMHISKDDILPQISDLTADNGDDTYGTSEDLVTLLSCNQYRKYRKLIPKYGDDWIWTVTPYSCYANHAINVRFVYPSGELSSSDATSSLGVVPICLFKVHKLESYYNQFKEQNQKVINLINKIKETVINSSVDMYVYIASILTDTDYDILESRYFNNDNEVEKLRTVIKDILLNKIKYLNHDIEFEPIFELIKNKFSFVNSCGDKDDFSMFYYLLGFIQVNRFIKEGTI